MPSEISIVTGGNSGLGFEIAKGLVERGCNVCIVGRNEDKLKKATEELAKINTDVRIIDFKANVGNEKDVKELFDELHKQGMKIKRLYNSAGVGRFGSPDTITQNTIETVFEANLVGLILITSFSLREMKEEGGLIVNIMSKSALTGRSNDSVYCAAKWGARGFTESIKAATEGTNIKVIGVYPGGINTKFWNEESKVPADLSKYMDPADAAKQILEISLSENSCCVSDITINRR